MVLNNLLLTKRTTILEQWLSLVLDTYPTDTERFFKEERDRFLNPVRSAISQGIEALYDEIIGDMNSDRISCALDSVVRIRSVQDFSPSQAVECVFFLKKVIREALRNEFHDSRISEELLTVELRIDRLALLAFDIYMKCREKIFEITVNKIKAEREQALKLLERTNRLIRKLGGAEQDLKKGVLESDI